MRWLAIALWLATGAVGAYLVRRGWSFYKLGLDARIDHPEFRTLRPSGEIGHGYGVVGTLLIATNLLYLLRRKLAWLEGMGSMRVWLEVHVFTGLLGGLFVAFHSAFQLRTPIATATSVSLAVVVGTGIVGRFLYMLAPRADVRPVAEALAALEAHVPGLGAPVAAALEEHRPYEPPADAGLLSALASLPRWSRDAAHREEAVDLLVNNSTYFSTLEPAERKLAWQALKRTIKAARGEVRAVAAAALLRSWRSLHRFFAILMVITVIVHIGVAWYYGYRWIFS